MVAFVNLYIKNGGGGGGHTASDNLCD